MRIRQATVEDAANLYALRKTIFDETDNMLFSSTEYGGSEEQEKGQIEWFHQQSNSCLLLAEQDDELLGLLGLIGGHAPRVAHSAELFVGVKRSHWNKGIGAQLIQTGIVKGHEIGLSRLHLRVNANNPRAIKLYERLGFQREGILKNAIRIDQKMIDQLAMALTPL